MRDTEFDDDDDKSSPIAALAGVLASPTAAADDINSSPLAALNAAMATPSTETALPKDTLDDPPAFASPIVTNVTGEVASIAPTSTADFDDDDLRPRGGLRDLIASVTGSRRNLAIVGGGLGVIIIASALAFCGGSSKPKPVASADNAAQAKATAPEPAPEPTPEPVANPEPTEPAPTEGSGENLGPTAEELAAANEPSEPASSEPTASEPAPSEPSEPATTKTKTKASTQTTAATKPTTRPQASTHTTPTQASTQTPATKTKTTHKTVAVAQPKPEPRPASNLGGKQVVAETDGQARAGKSVAGVDQSSLQKARGAYLSGNKRLFAGDAASATKHYRQALSYYAGYVAAYRGLGLAYEKLGDKANALKAFRTYIGSAPSAPDAGTIKQRIAALQR